MKINIKLKIKLIELILQKNRFGGNITGIPMKKKEELYHFILEQLADPLYIVYKEGNKYNSVLQIVCKEELKKYFELEYDICSLDTLDVLNVSALPLLDDSLVMEVYTAGKFNFLLNRLKENFEFDKTESRLLN